MVFVKTTVLHEIKQIQLRHNTYPKLKRLERFFSFAI